MAWAALVRGTTVMAASDRVFLILNGAFVRPVLGGTNGNRR